MNRRLLIAMLIAVSLLGLLVWSLLAPKKAVSPTPSPSISPSADVFAEERKLLETSSKEVAAKFYSFNQANDPAYFNSIKPYLTTSLYNNTVEVNTRYAGRVPFLEPIQSEAERASVYINGSERATAEVRIKSRLLKGSEPYGQTIEIKWVKHSGKWLVEAIAPSESEREVSPPNG